MGKFTKRLAKRILTLSLTFILTVVILNFPVTTKQGINGKVRILEIPLYIKTMEYLDRNYHYRTLAKEITRGSATEREKVIAIFTWITENIHKVPEGFDVIDDHVLNIIIRRYGMSDQMADAFTTLCVYAGVPAFWRVERLGNNKGNLVLSYVRLNGEWRVFDVYRDIIFRNAEGEIASVEDIISDISIVREKHIAVKGIPYEDYFSNLKPINKNFISKEQKQVPLYRLIYEVRRIFGDRRNIHNEEQVPF